MADNTYLDGTPKDHDGFELPTEIPMLTQERAFLGEMSAIIIFEGIENQFRDCINMDDLTNYVDIFYKQLDDSYNEINEHDDEQYPMEIRETLDTIHRQFVDLMQKMISTYLTIGITDLESGILHRDDLELIFRKIYEYFILNAKKVFKTVIAMDMKQFVSGLPDDDNFHKSIHAEMEKYIPLFKEMTMDQFLKYHPDEEILGLYNDSKITGNFLRKYSPKFYKNEEFLIEVVNYITLICQFQKEMVDATHPD